MVGSRVDPEQVQEREPAELRVWLGSFTLHAQGPGFDHQYSKVKANANNETEGKITFWPFQIARLGTVDRNKSTFVL